MSEAIGPSSSPSYHPKSEQASTWLDTTPPLTLPRTSINAHVHQDHPIHSHHAAMKAEAIAEKALPGSAIHETEPLFQRGVPKNGAAIFAALKVLKDT